MIISSSSLSFGSKMICTFPGSFSNNSRDSYDKWLSFIFKGNETLLAEIVNAPCSVLVRLCKCNDFSGIRIKQLHVCQRNFIFIDVLHNTSNGLCVTIANRKKKQK